MRTTITIPDALMKDLLQYAHTKKTTEAVCIAIQDWLRLKKINEIKNLQGKLSIDGHLRELRNKDKKKMEKLDE